MSKDEPSSAERLENIEILLEDAGFTSNFVELTFGMVQVKMALERIEAKLGTTEKHANPPSSQNPRSPLTPESPARP